MVHRIANLSKSNSFFLFGARGTGKSHLIHEHFKSEAHILNIDLLKSEWEDGLLKNPDSLIKIIDDQKIIPRWVVIDEVQKIPKLLDIVHHLIENRKLNLR